MSASNIAPLLLPKWKSICREMAGGSLLGDDLYQHCILKILERGTEGIKDVEAYFYLIVKHEWHGDRNKFRRMYSSDGDDIPVADITDSDGEVQDIDIDSIFEDLSNEEKALVAAQVMIGGVPDIAKRYDIPERTLRYNISKIQQKCRSKLAKMREL